MNKDLDMVLYGATGFTGTLCAEYLAKNLDPTKWAVAGRNSSKLEKLVQSIGVDVEVILADADDIEGLNDMTARSKSCFQLLVHFTDMDQTSSRLA